MYHAPALNHSGSPARIRAEGFRLRIGGGSRAAGRARRELDRLRAELDGPVLEVMRLLVTELVTSSVRHGGAAAVELVVIVGSQRVRVEICNPGAPLDGLAGGAGRGSEPGWGLFLVERLSDTWGVIDEAGYQRAWFEIRRR